MTSVQYPEQYLQVRNRSLFILRLHTAWSLSDLLSLTIGDVWDGEKPTRYALSASKTGYCSLQVRVAIRDLIYALKMRHEGILDESWPVFQAWWGPKGLTEYTAVKLLAVERAANGMTYKKHYAHLLQH